MSQTLKSPQLTYLDPRRGTLVRAGLTVACLLWTGFHAPAQQVITASTTQLGIAAQPALPDFRTVTGAVENYFAGQSDFQRSDLISRGQVEKALDAVTKAGWDVPEREAILKRALGDNSFLMSELSTQSGRAFMRKITRYPGTYARLDRLSSISGGQAVVRTLVRQKGGDEFVQYLATTKGGHNLGGMMTSAQQGVDLNKPTGRIYTVEDLITELKNVYEKTFP